MATHCIKSNEDILKITSLLPENETIIMEKCIEIFGSHLRGHHRSGFKIFLQNFKNTYKKEQTMLLRNIMRNNCGKGRNNQDPPEGFCQNIEADLGIQVNSEGNFSCEQCNIKYAPGEDLKNTLQMIEKLNLDNIAKKVQNINMKTGNGLIRLLY